MPYLRLRDANSSGAVLSLGAAPVSGGRRDIIGPQTSISGDGVKFAIIPEKSRDDLWIPFSPFISDNAYRYE